jgi:hypothetical protein
VIPALERLKQDNGEFKASLGYLVRPGVKEKKGCTVYFLREFS